MTSTFFLFRCHRIGQTRDVHIYRLISERSIEENIIKKANQKRLLGDLAIEGGNFTTAFFKKDTIKDLFEVSNNSANNGVDEAIMTPVTTTTTTALDEPTAEATNGQTEDKSTTKKAAKAFESAIAQVEDDTDREVSFNVAMAS